MRQPPTPPTRTHHTCQKAPWPMFRLWVLKRSGILLGRGSCFQSAARGGIRTCQATGSQKGPAARGHAQRGARKRVHIPLVSPKQQENTLLKGQVRFIDARRARNAGRVVVRTISPVRHTCATHRCHLCTPTPRILPVVGRTLAGPSHRCGGACVCRRRVTSVTHPNVLLSPRHRGQGWRSPRPRCSGRTCRQRVASQSRPGFPSQGV